MSAAIVAVGDGLSVEVATGEVSVQKSGTGSSKVSGYVLVTGIALDLGTDVPALLENGKLPEPGTAAASTMHNGKFVYDVKLLAPPTERSGKERRRIAESKASNVVIEKLSLGWAAVDSDFLGGDDVKLGGTLDSWAFEVVNQQLLHQSHDASAAAAAAAGGRHKGTASASAAGASFSRGRGDAPAGSGRAKVQLCGCTDGRCTEDCCTADIPVSALEGYDIGRQARINNVLGVEIDGHNRSISYMIRGRRIGTAFRRVCHDALRGAGKKLIPIVSFVLSVTGSSPTPFMCMRLGGPDDVAAPLIKARGDLPIGIGWLPHLELVALENRRLLEAAAAIADAEAAAAAAAAANPGGEDAAATAAVPGPTASGAPPVPSDIESDAALAAALAADSSADLATAAAAAAAASSSSSSASAVGGSAGRLLGASGTATHGSALDSSLSSALDGEEDTTRIAFVESADDKAPEPELGALEKPTAAQLWENVQDSSMDDTATASKLGETIFFFVGGNTEVLRGRIHPIADETEVPVSSSRRGESLFHAAAASGKVGTARFLIDMAPGGVDINARAKGGDRGTPLHRAIEAGRAEFVSFLLSPISRPMGEPVTARPSLELPNLHGITPVQLATQLCNSTVLAALREAGVEVEERVAGNNNNVHIACASLDLAAIEAALAIADPQDVVAKNDSGARPADVLISKAREAVVAPMLSALLNKNPKALDHVQNKTKGASGAMIFSLLAQGVTGNLSGPKWDVAKGKFTTAPVVIGQGRTIKFTDGGSVVPLSQGAPPGTSMRVAIKIINDAHKDETSIMGFVRNRVESTNYKANLTDQIFFRPYNGEISGNGGGIKIESELKAVHLGETIIMELFTGAPGIGNGFVRVQLPGQPMKMVLDKLPCANGDLWFPAVGCYSSRKQVLELVSVRISRGGVGHTSLAGGAGAGIEGLLSRDDKLIKDEMEQTFMPALMPVRSGISEDAFPTGLASETSAGSAAASAGSGAPVLEAVGLSAAASATGSLTGSVSMTGGLDFSDSGLGPGLDSAPSVSIVESLEGVAGSTATDKDTNGQSLFHALIKPGMLKERDAAVLKARGVSPFITDAAGILPARLAAGGTLAETIQALHGVVVSGTAQVRSDREKVIDDTFKATRFAPSDPALSDSDSSDDEETRSRRRARKGLTVGKTKLDRTWYTKLLTITLEGKLKHMRYREHPAPKLGSKVKEDVFVVRGPHWDGSDSGTTLLGKVESDIVVGHDTRVLVTWVDDTKSTHAFTPDIQALTAIDIDDMAEEDYAFPLKLTMLDDYELKYRKRPQTYDERLFVPGLFVVKGYTWKWGDQDTNGVGWITSIREPSSTSEPGWVTVQWYGGSTPNSYRVGGAEHLSDVAVIDIDPDCDARLLLAGSAGTSLEALRAYVQCRVPCYTPEGRSVIKGLEDASPVPLAAEDTIASSTSADAGAGIGGFVRPEGDEAGVTSATTASSSSAGAAGHVYTDAELTALPLTSDVEGDVSLYSLVAQYGLSGSLPAAQSVLVSLVLNAQAAKLAETSIGSAAGASAFTSEYGERTLVSELRFDPALLSSANSVRVSADGQSVSSTSASSQAVLARVPLRGGNRYKVAFELVKDTSSQTVCFGFGVPGAVSHQYESKESSHWTLRAYNGNLSGSGQTDTTTKIKVYSGDVITFEVDLRPGHGTISFETRGEHFRNCFSGLPTTATTVLLPCVHFYGGDRTARLLSATELTQDALSHKFELRSRTVTGCAKCTSCGLSLVSPDVWLDMAEWSVAEACRLGEKHRFLTAARALIASGNPAVVEPSHDDDDAKKKAKKKKEEAEEAARRSAGSTGTSTDDTGTKVKICALREASMQVQVTFFGDSSPASGAGAGSSSSSDEMVGEWVDAKRIRLLEPIFDTNRLYTPPAIPTAPAALCPSCFRADGKDLIVEPYASALELLPRGSTTASAPEPADQPVYDPVDEDECKTALRTLFVTEAVDGSTLLHDCAQSGRLAWLQTASAVCNLPVALWGSGSGIPTPLEVALANIPVIDPGLSKSSDDAPLEAYDSSDDEDEELLSVKKLIKTMQRLGGQSCRKRIVAVGILGTEADGEEEKAGAALRIVRSRSRRGSGEDALLSLTRASSHGSDSGEEVVAMPVNTSAMYGLVILDESSGSAAALDQVGVFDVAAHTARTAKAAGTEAVAVATSAGAGAAPAVAAASGAGAGTGDIEDGNGKLVCAWVQLRCFAETFDSSGMTNVALKRAVMSTEAWHRSYGRDISGAPISPSVDTVMLLLELADASMPDDRATELPVAMRSVSSALLHSAVLLQLSARIEQLKRLGARLEDSTDAQGRTPLHVLCAAPAPSLQMVSRLLDLNASARVRDSSNALPLHYAARCTNPVIGAELVEMIVDQMRQEIDKELKATARLDATTTSTDVAAMPSSGSATGAAAARADAGDDNGDEQKDPVELRLAQEADSFDSRMRRPLHFACRAGNIDTVETLIEMGCVVDHADDSWPPLHDAVRHGRRNVVRLLPSFGLDINKCNRKTGNTALHLAVQRRSRGLVDMLLEHGARPDMPNSDGRTPMRLASDMRAHDVLGLLHEALEQAATATNASGTNAAAELASVVGDRLIDPQHVTLSNAIGEGGFGVVMEATLKERPGTLVVVKQLKTVTKLDGEHRDMLLQEVKTMQLACSTHHPAVLQFIGLVAQDNGMSANGKPLAYGLVLEHAAGGSLRNLLDSDDVVEDLNLLRRLKLLSDVASGLAFLHMPQTTRPPIAHRDLKPDNILLDLTRTRAMISDFGLSKVRDVAQRATKTSKFATTMQYRAPEAWTSRRKAAKAAAAAGSDAIPAATATSGTLHGRGSPARAGDRDIPVAVRKALAQDVFSLGVMIWETVSLLEPFFGASDIRDVHEDIVVNKCLPGPLQWALAPEFCGFTAADNPRLTTEEAAELDAQMNAEADQQGFREESTRDIVDLEWFDSPPDGKAAAGTGDGHDTQGVSTAEQDAPGLNQATSAEPEMDFGMITGYADFQDDEDYDIPDEEAWIRAARAMPRSLAELIARCCAYDPFERPGSAEVAEELLRIRASVAQQIRARGKGGSKASGSDAMLARALDEQPEHRPSAPVDADAYQDLIM